jgi:acetyl esterase
MSDAGIDIALDPAIHRWAKRIQELASALPDLASGDDPSRRAAEVKLSNRLASEFTLPAPDDVAVIRETVSTPASPLDIHRYRPSGLPALAPTQLALHGGGFVSGSIREEVNARLLSARARAAGIQVIALEYRLAPEHPYPAAVDDAIGAIRALRASPELHGVDLSRLGIGGNSAGGGIAASTVFRLRDLGENVLIHQALEVPALTMRPFGESAHAYARGFGLDDHERLAAAYLGPDVPPDPYASPVDVDDLSGLPPTLVHVAEHDPLRDAALEFARRLADVGVRNRVEMGAGHVHGSPALTATFDAARAWQRTAALALAEAYGTTPNL